MFGGYRICISCIEIPWNDIVIAYNIIIYSTYNTYYGIGRIPTLVVEQVKINIYSIKKLGFVACTKFFRQTNLHQCKPFFLKVKMYYYW